MKSVIYFIAFLFPSAAFAQIDNEPTNNILVGADALTLGISNNAKINPDGDADYFKFTVLRSGIILYKFQNVPSTIRLEGLLFGPSDQPIAGSGHFEGAGIGYTWETKVCEPGLYRLKVVARDGNSSSDPYKVTVSVDTSDVCECNDNLLTASHLNLDMSKSAAIRTAVDVDFYKFTVPRSGIILYKFQNVPSNIRLEGLLVDPNDQPVPFSNHFEAAGIGYTWETKVCEAGEYRLKVSARDGNASPDLYKVTVSIDTSDLCECNDVPLTASPLGLNVPKSAAIRTAGDVDFYKFTVPRSGILLYKFENVPPTIRIEGKLYDPDGAEVPSSNAYGNAGQNYTWETKVCQGENTG